MADKPEESMPRKSKDRVSRWGTHQEMKGDRKQRRNRSKQRWKQKAEEEIRETRAWLLKQCKFAQHQ